MELTLLSFSQVTKNNFCPPCIWILFSDAAQWITFEIFNIPWRDEFSDFSSPVFKNAKYIVERAVQLAFFLDNLKAY